MYNFKENESLYATIVDTVTPTTSTEGVVGQFYIDQSTDPASLYLCTKVETVDSTTTYTWTKQGGKQLYQHNIRLGYGNVSTIVISDDSLSFDNEKLRQWLKNQGYTAAYQGYLVYNTTPSVTVSGSSYYDALPNMLYTNSDASNLILNYYDLNNSLKSTITINDESINFVKDTMCQFSSTSLLNNTITDTVVAL